MMWLVVVFISCGNLTFIIKTATFKLRTTASINAVWYQTLTDYFVVASFTNQLFFDFQHISVCHFVDFSDAQSLTCHINQALNVNIHHVSTRIIYASFLTSSVRAVCSDLRNRMNVSGEMHTVRTRNIIKRDSQFYATDRGMLTDYIFTK